MPSFMFSRRMCKVGARTHSRKGNSPKRVFSSLPVLQWDSVQHVIDVALSQRSSRPQGSKSALRFLVAFLHLKSSETTKCFDQAPVDLDMSAQTTSTTSQQRDLSTSGQSLSLQSLGDGGKDMSQEQAMTGDATLCFAVLNVFQEAWSSWDHLDERVRLLYIHIVQLM